MLFIDDRISGGTLGLLARQWTVFQLSQSSSSATAYVTYQGKRYSLRRASTFNLIYSYLYVYINGQWYYYDDPEKIIFEPGKLYAIYTFVNSTTLTVFYAGNHYLDARGRQDMVEAARRDSRFGAAKRETYQENPDWDPTWELRYMDFDFSGGRRVTIYQAMNKSNPLVRLTTYYDPDKRAWTPWDQRF